MISSMYKTKLEQQGYEILLAANGSDGLQTAQEKKPDVILLDIILPQLDGFSVLERLKADKSAKNIPVFLLTNLATEEDKEKGQQLGATDYLVKANLTPADIMRKVEECVSGEQPDKQTDNK